MTDCPGGRKTVPLALKLWSSRSPGFKGENDEVLKILKAVYAATGGKGVTVYDRGGDRPALKKWVNSSVVSPRTIARSAKFRIDETAARILNGKALRLTEDERGA